MTRLKIYLHGHLKDKIKKDYVEVEANTIYDGLKALVSKYKNELKAPIDLGRWKIRVRDFDTKESWYVPLFVNEIHIYPLFKTAKSQWATIAIGVGLMLLAGPAGGLFTNTVTTSTVTATAATATSAAVTQFMTYAGASLLIQGVMDLLFPVPKTNTSAEAKTNSKYLGSPETTVAAGTRIPFGYGKYKLGGHYISYNISSTLLIG